MSERGEEEQDESFRLGGSEILYILFKHKWKILVLSCVGVLAATSVGVVMPPHYKSEAKLYVPYVVDRNAVDAADEATTTSRANDAIINSEVEILTSLDLVIKTLDAVRPGASRQNPKRTIVTSDVVRGVAKGIKVEVEKGMNVITVSYKDSDPIYATRFLRELLKNYREKHLEIHRFPQGLDVITQRRDEVRRQLDKTESELKRLKNEVQSLSLADSTVTLSAAISKAQEELNAAEAERRGQEARLDSLESTVPALALITANPNRQPPSDKEAERHRFIVQLLTELRGRERSLLAVYPPESRMVKIPQKQISELDEQRRALERRFPDLALMEPADGTTQAKTNVYSERARLAEMKATEEALRGQLQHLQERRENFSELAPLIARLELDKQVLEVNYKNIETNLGKVHDDRAVDWSKISNIASLQEPSPAAIDIDPLQKKLKIGLMLSGLALGIGIAFIRETALQRKLKRPCELEERLRIPLLLSIPFIRDGERSRFSHRIWGREPARLQNVGERSVHAPWATDHFLRPFCEAIRDHILLSFEIRNLDHTPKLIGVTGFSGGAGTTSLAAGLAAALSEIGDGKVLLVDMNVERGETHPLFQGTPALSLS
ncbi:MAG: hypothetical protein EOP84_13615, partial [Verrucomicrobiaceae bacterium]